MASFIPKIIRQLWQRDGWVRPENRVTRSVEGRAEPEAADPVIGADTGKQPDEAA